MTNKEKIYREAVKVFGNELDAMEYAEVSPALYLNWRLRDKFKAAKTKGKDREVR